MPLYFVAFLVKSGRAVVFPEYKGTFERFLPKWPDRGTNSYRDVIIEDAKDLRRSIDYFETRPEFDHERLAYYGFSWGALNGSIFLAVENRFKVAVLTSGGLSPSKVLPEINPINYAPHVTIPVLMINGRYDFVLPLETCQTPLFSLLGSPPSEKRHVILESGHGLPLTPWFKETLDWLDHYLGAVN